MNAESLVNQIQAYNPEVDFELFRRCYKYGQEHHRGHLRKSGEPYFETHCIETAKTLIGLRLDTQTICAGLLHDVIEDTSATRDELASLFGETIAHLVEGVTQIGKYQFKGGTHRWQAENYLKLLLATAEDIRVILIKLADRLHNMETLSFLPMHKQQENAKETLDVYAPLAHRLGIHRIRSRLEDLAFKHLHPIEYKEIASLLAEKLGEREAYKDKMVEIITWELEAAGIETKVYGRPKHIYSIHNKIHQKGTPFEKIRDLIGLRILVNTTPECYSAIGILHSKWRHIPERFKDLIGLRKANGYQSLHTTIMDGLDGGRSVEIQVRTFEMHEVAEYGIAAHWSYKQGTPSTKEGKSIFAELRQILKDIQEFKDPPYQVIQSMKREMRQELFSDEVYVFSPKGDLYALPADSTPIDFAYKIHTDIGHTCCGAEVNGTLVPLKYRLQNGDRVKILTNARGTPRREWRRWVRTTTARAKIRRWFNEQDKVRSLVLGKKFLEDEMRRHHLEPRSSIKSPELLKVIEKLKLKTIEELLMQIGNGKLSAPDVVKLLMPEDAESKEKKQPPVPDSVPAIQLEDGIDIAIVRVMKCCQPIPGDEIVGYITRGRGVSMHKAECLRILDEPERMIHVEWKFVEGVTYPVAIVVACDDRPGMLGEITTLIAQCKVNIRAGNFGTVEAMKHRSSSGAAHQPESNGTAYDRLTLEVTGVEQLEFVIAAIRRLKGVQWVTRKT